MQSHNYSRSGRFGGMAGAERSGRIGRGSQGPAGRSQAGRSHANRSRMYSHSRRTGASGYGQSGRSRRTQKKKDEVYDPDDPTRIITPRKIIDLSKLTHGFHRIASGPDFDGERSRGERTSALDTDFGASSDDARQNTLSTGVRSGTQTPFYYAAASERRVVQTSAPPGPGFVPSAAAGSLWEQMFGRETLDQAGVDLWAGVASAGNNVGMEVKEQETAVKPLTREQLEEDVNIRIMETPTMTLMHLPATLVSQKDEILWKATATSNQAYNNCVEQHKEKGMYTERAAQTFNRSVRDARIQAFPPAKHNAGVQASPWDIFDEFNDISSHNVAHAEMELESMLSGRDDGSEGKESQNNPLGSGDTSASDDLLNVDAAAGGLSGSASLLGVSSHLASMTATGGRTAGGASSTPSVSAGASARNLSGDVTTPSAGSRRLTDKSGGLLRVPRNDPLARLFHGAPFRRAVWLVEQAVIQNDIHELHMLYRNHPEAGSIVRRLKQGAQQQALTGSSAASWMGHRLDGSIGAGAVGPSDVSLGTNGVMLIPLWTYECALVKGYEVTCMDWNKLNSDLLAVGYGSAKEEDAAPVSQKSDANNTQESKDDNSTTGTSASNTTGTATAGASKKKDGGYVLFWSKNPTYPAKIFKTPSRVTSLAFSDTRHHLLAVGMYNGSVCIYDVRSNKGVPALSATHESGKHSEPVWGVSWVTQETHKGGQSLVSISSDGTVMRWNYKKGLVPRKIMKFTRIPNKAKLRGTMLEGVSRDASGMCFDFPGNGGIQYVAGTEDGLIHKCSLSYQDSTLENYYGHTAPVYKVRCSPILPECFLSCSADWTVKLWSQSSTSPILEMKSENEAIMDVAWSPTKSCVFATVSRGGTLAVWNLHDSPLDPVNSRKIPGSTSCVTWGPEGIPVLLAGNSLGQVQVFSVQGLDLIPPSSTAQSSGDILEAEMVSSPIPSPGHEDATNAQAESALAEDNEEQAERRREEARAEHLRREQVRLVKVLQEHSSEKTRAK